MARPTNSQTITKLHINGPLPESDGILYGPVRGLRESCLDRLCEQIHLHILAEGSICGGDTRPRGHPRSLTEIVHCATGLFEGAILAVPSKPTSSMAPYRLNKCCWGRWFHDVTRASFLVKLTQASIPLDQSTIRAARSTFTTLEPHI